ncbi:NAD(P)-binding protein [Xylaria intraflava]|nr:NAD(P)-binding protein [Xylaria intraflava]
MLITMPDFDVNPEKRATRFAFLKRQLFVTPPAVTGVHERTEGKTAVVTGANSGLGFEVARQLLELRIGRLILAVRSETRGEIARKQLISNTSFDDRTIIEIWPLDLSNYDSVMYFANRTKSLDRLDIFVNNAALAKLDFEINSSSGHEEIIQVNYLSTVLLVILLLPVLKEKNTTEHPGRIVLVSSDVASWAKFKEKDSLPLFSAMDDRTNFEIVERYSTSKLLGQLFLFELAKHIPPTVAIVNAPNPGLCETGLGREADGTFGGFVFDMIKKLIARPASIGARTIVDAAIRHGLETHGQYLEDGKIQPHAPFVYRPEGQKIAQQLWKETLEELAFAKISTIIDSLGIKDKL